MLKQGSKQTEVKRRLVRNAHLGAAIFSDTFWESYHSQFLHYRGYDYKIHPARVLTHASREKRDM